MPENGLEWAMVFLVWALCVALTIDALMHGASPVVGGLALAIQDVAFIALVRLLMRHRLEQ